MAKRDYYEVLGVSKTATDDIWMQDKEIQERRKNESKNKN